MSDVSGAPSALILVGRVSMAVLLGLLTALFTIAFAAMIYSGPFSAHLGQGIAHTLLGSIVSALLGSFLMTYKGSLLTPQDLTAIAIAGGLSGAVAGQALGPQGLAATVGAVVIVASASAGLATFFFGVFGMGRMARFIPYPVIGGFLAATGYLLVVAAIRMCLQTDAVGPRTLVEPGNLVLWLPWLVAGVLLAVGSRIVKNSLFLPAAFLALIAGFYAVLAASGLSSVEATERGLLLGPFASNGFVHDLNARILLDADWAIVLTQLPVIPAIMALTIVGSMLNGGGLETALRKDFDVERDLRATGIGNLGAAVVGGMPTYHAVAEPLLASKFDLPDRTVPIVAALAAAIALIYGAGVLELLPIGVFAALIAFLGFDMLIIWLWEKRRELTAKDRLLVLGILLVAMLFGFLIAIVVGFLAAMVLFLVTYARIDVVHQRSTLGEHRSRVERPLADHAVLAEKGNQTVILELDGFLFFGTASAVRQEVQELLRKTPPSCLILDFTRVKGIDASALQSLSRVASDCATLSVPLQITALADDDAARLSSACDARSRPTFMTGLDEALERAEEAVLAARPETPDATETQALVARLEVLAGSGDAAVAKLVCGANSRIIEAGGEGDDLFLLLSGRARAEVDTPSGRRLRVAAFRPGAVIGELAHYAGVTRTADVVAEDEATLLRIDLKRLSVSDPTLAASMHDHVARLLGRRVINMTTMLRRAAGPRAKEADQGR